MKTKVGILGGGESGVGAALLAQREGYEIFLSDAGKLKEKFRLELDAAGLQYEEGGHEKIIDFNPAILVKSPGIPSEAEVVQKLIAGGAELISEIEFAYRHTKAYLIGITGSNGKTTTAHLLYHMLQKAGLNVGLAGNVGKSFARQLTEKEHDYYVIEISSFQLDDVAQMKLPISILLNITPDHLDRYQYSLELYADAKLKIAKNTTEEDYFIYNADDPVIAEGMERNPIQAKKIPFSQKQKLEEGAYNSSEELIINHKNQSFIMSIHDLALQGKHNLYNSMAAGIATRILDLRKEVIRESLSDFQNVEHRLETVASVHGIEFINDSKATNVNSTWYALESLSRPVVWIVGGVDKGNDYSELMPLVEEKVKAIICLGKDNKKIIDAFKEKIQIIEESTSAEDAVRKAYEIGAKGDVVLLSPACASFDLFENYEDRGHQFKKAVKAL
ncbi:MAG: UDP-N-acetylmuramoyl-L-alanine--D-glutamate ligase [Flavobacteriales bacterium]|nr:UDP-N-acetylmuramoyl-L-alanine--D-glutamate ligase [Flavobacteriales bacterium]